MFILLSQIYWSYRMNNARNVYQYIKEVLLERYEPGEADAMSRWIMEHVYNIDWNGILAERQLEQQNDQMSQVENILERLHNYEPIQYILGEVIFFHLKLKVNPNVLIPRPETEELIGLIIDKHKKDKSLKILDIGTGSGCIALALASLLPQSNVIGIDFDAGALQVARENAGINQMPVTWLQLDILNQNLPENEYDIIVSNPPYICESEKKDMQPNVLEYEPAKALFIPDAKPLLFYRHIVNQANFYLNPGGYLYFEVNKIFATDVALLLKQQNYEAVTIVKDISENPRIVWARKPAK
jgi:release factor glutamine methyltransferase